MTGWSLFHQWLRCASCGSSWASRTFEARSVAGDSDGLQDLLDLVDGLRGCPTHDPVVKRVLRGQASDCMTEFVGLQPILSIHDLRQAAPLIVSGDGDRNPTVAAGVVVGAGIDAVRARGGGRGCPAASPLDRYWPRRSPRRQAPTLRLRTARDRCTGLRRCGGRWSSAARMPMNPNVGGDPVGVGDAGADRRSVGPAGHARDAGGRLQGEAEAAKLRVRPGLTLHRH